MESKRHWFIVRKDNGKRLANGNKTPIDPVLIGVIDPVLGFISLADAEKWLARRPDMLAIYKVDWRD